MHKYIYLIITILFSTKTIAQVAVGNIDVTKNSPEDFVINGNVIISGDVGKRTSIEKLKEYKTIDNKSVPTKFNLIAVDPTEKLIDNKIVKGQIKEINSTEQILPIIIQQYEIQNILKDDLNDLDLQIPTSKYFIAISNFEAVDNKKEGFQSTDGQRGRFQYEVFQKNNTWRVRIGNPSIDPLTATNTFNYNFDIIIYSKKFFNDIGIVTFNNVGQNGNAGDTVIVQ